MKHHKHAVTGSRAVGRDDELVIELLFRGFARSLEAERRLNECVSDREADLAREQLCRVKLELQQVLDEYVDSRIGRWFGARAGKGGVT